MFKTLQTLARASSGAFTRRKEQIIPLTKKGTKPNSQTSDGSMWRNPSVRHSLNEQFEMNNQRPKFSNSHNQQTNTLSAHKRLIITRQLEMLNVFIGYEQANKYAIKTEDGLDAGYIAEAEQGIMGAILRQVLRTRRKLDADVLDANGTLAFKVFDFIRSIDQSIG